MFRCFDIATVVVVAVILLFSSLLWMEFEMMVPVSTFVKRSDLACWLFLVITSRMQSASRKRQYSSRIASLLLSGRGWASYLNVGEMRLRWLEQFKRQQAKCVLPSAPPARGA